jgi:hypothetical protein
VYASLPLSGPARDAGRDVLRGAERALAELAGDGVELVALDSGGDGPEARAADAARTATGDDDAVAYLGDFHSSQVAVSSAILGTAGLPQVAPVATWAELGGPTLILLMANDVGTAQAVLYVGVAGSGAAHLWHELHAANPAMWLLGTEGAAVPWLAKELSPAAAERTRFFVAPTAPLDSYGYDAMALILDAVAEGGEDRGAVVRAARAKHTPPTAYGVLAVTGGELVSA